MIAVRTVGGLPSEPSFEPRLEQSAQTSELLRVAKWVLQVDDATSHPETLAAALAIDLASITELGRSKTRLATRPLVETLMSLSALDSVVEFFPVLNTLEQRSVLGSVASEGRGAGALELGAALAV